MPTLAGTVIALAAILSRVDYQRAFRDAFEPDPDPWAPLVRALSATMAAPKPPARRPQPQARGVRPGGRRVTGAERAAIQSQYEAVRESRLRAMYGATGDNRFPEALADRGPMYARIFG